MGAASFGWGMGDHGMDFWFNLGPMLLFGWLWTLLPFILVGGLIYWLTTRDAERPSHPPQGHGGAHPSGALAIAEERYARGEISREEYLRLKEDLSQR